MSDKHWEFLNYEPGFMKPKPKKINIPVRALGIAKIVIVNKHKKGWV